MAGCCFMELPWDSRFVLGPERVLVNGEYASLPKQINIGLLQLQIIIIIHDNPVQIFMVMIHDK